MAAETGRKNPGVSERLFQESHRFDFFQAVRVLERWAQEQARLNAHPERAAVGYDTAPAQEIVRFRATAALSFPAGSISQLRTPSRKPEDDSDLPPLPEMNVGFLGLTGPSGVLPRHYTEMLIQRVRDHDYSLRDFLDLFHHRLISLFYRAWEKYRLPVTYERSKLRGSGLDLATQGLFCLVGLGTNGLRGRLEIDDEAFLFFSGHFAHFPRSASALEALLGDYLEMPISVLQLQGQWLYLSPDDIARMPSPSFPKGLNNQLGLNLVVGEKVWDVQSKFRLRVGPLNYRQFRSLMPNGDALLPLCQLARTYVGPELDFDVQPVLKPEEVPWCQLKQIDGDGPFLGWNTWVRSQPFTREVDDTTFSLESV
jgi:type VI secretion system protein ImpH